MRGLLILVIACLALSGAGCRNITQDTFGWEVERTNTLRTAVHGDLHVRILHQREGWGEPLTTYETLVVLDSTITAFELEFGVLWSNRLDIVRYITIYIVDDNSSLWESICWDRPSDLEWIDACTLPVGWLFQQVGYEEPTSPVGLPPVQIAIIRSVYARGRADIGVYTHELMHTLIWVGLGYFDHDHSTPGAWESGAVGHAAEIAASRL